MPNIIEIDFWIYPLIVFAQARGFVTHIYIWKLFPIRVHTLVKLSCKQLYTQDTEDQPKHQANQQNVSDTGNGREQRVNCHLQR